MNFKHEEIGVIKLAETSTLKVSIVNDRDLDIRLWVQLEEYSGPTKKGVRFSLLEGDAWTKFKELMEMVDGEYKQLNKT